MDFRTQQIPSQIDTRNPVEVAAHHTIYFSSVFASARARGFFSFFLLLLLSVSLGAYCIANARGTFLSIKQQLQQLIQIDFQSRQEEK